MHHIQKTSVFFTLVFVPIYYSLKKQYIRLIMYALQIIRKDIIIGIFENI